MAHMVEIIDGVAQMAYAGETPWHGLGHQVSNDLTPVEMMNASGTNWEVRKEPAVVKIDGEYVNTGRSALLRSSDNYILDVISDDWNPTQNATAFEFFREYVEAGKMTMETAGSLDNGRNVWALAKIGSSFQAVKGDVTEGYLLFSNPHKYGRAITVKFTTVRVVCNNTLTWALDKGGSQSVSVHHGRVFNPEEVKTTLGIASHQMHTMEETAKFLVSKRYTPESLRQMIMEVFPSTADKTQLSRPAETVLSVMKTQPGAQFGEGSYWQALNAVTFSVDHLLGRKQETRLNSAWFGVNDNRKRLALKKAVEYAKAA